MNGALVVADVQLQQLEPAEVWARREELTDRIFKPAVRAADYPIQDPNVFQGALLVQTREHQPQRVAFMAMHDDHTVGIAVGHGHRPPPHPWFLAWLLVHPAFQGNGIGGRLHDAALGRVTARRAYGQTHQSAAVACGLYRTRGWVLTPRDHGWIRLDLDLERARTMSSPPNGGMS